MHQGYPRHFVLLSTTIRGIVDPPEPLDLNGQAAANMQQDLDEYTDSLSNRVVWNKKPVRSVGVDGLKRRSA